MTKEIVSASIIFILMALSASITNIICCSAHVRLLNNVGIKDIVHHETIVDGTCTTNWYEIVWINGNGNRP